MNINQLLQLNETDLRGLIAEAAQRVNNLPCPPKYKAVKKVLLGAVSALGISASPGSPSEELPEGS